MSVTALAHPNIALIKYWGKRDLVRNIPAVGSLSITLDTLRTKTRFDKAQSDSLSINGRSRDKDTVRVRKNLDDLRALCVRGAGPVMVTSEVNFPVAAGLASSASGFAALVVAANEYWDIGLDTLALARRAGAASGSAARSIYGGFVRLDIPEKADDEIHLEPLLGAADWPLELVIAVTSTEEKAVGSTEAMLRSAETSPYYPAWVDNQTADLDEAQSALANRDFQRLAEVSEFNCLKMHALTLSSRPALVYWNATTMALIAKVRDLRTAGIGVFFTIDAGPQIKAVCLPGEASKVAKVFAEQPGVVEVLRTGLGAGARVLP